jgi:hypothetical protein
MSCALGGDASAPAIASFLKVRLRRDRWRSSASVRNRAPPFNGAMKLSAPGSDGAPQLVAGLNGKRSPACRLSACSYGAPPPDHGPAPFRAPALRPQRGQGRERARAGARRRAVASFRLRAGPSRGLQGKHAAHRAPARGGGCRCDRPRKGYQSASFQS